MKISLRRRHALMVEVGAFSHEIDYVTIFREILNLKAHPNRITGSKVTAILLSGWILPIGGASTVKGLRLLPAQQACDRTITVQSSILTASPTSIVQSSIFIASPTVTVQSSILHSYHTIIVRSSILTASPTVDVQSSIFIASPTNTVQSSILTASP